MNQAVFIDRDGVICRNRVDHVKSWDEFVFLPGALDALVQLAHTRFRVVMVTNQAVINRNITTEDAVNEIHARMLAVVAAAGGKIDRVYYCPHRPDEHCTCRKPQPGMLLRAAEELNLDLSRSYLIGDALTDVQAGRAVGARNYLVLTGRGLPQWFHSLSRGERGFTVMLNLGTAVNAILWRERASADRVRGLPAPKGSG